MTARLVSVVNMKGGVGKSTTSVMLAETLALHHRRRVLLIDLDPQTNASIMAAGPDRWNALRSADRTLDVFFESLASNEGGVRFKALIAEKVSDLKGDPDVSLIATAPELRWVEREMIERFVKAGFDLDWIQQAICKWLARGFKSVMNDYDDIIVDCPPGISLFAEAALIASDAIIAPTIPDYVSRLGLFAFRRRALKMISEKRGAPSAFFVLATKFDREFPLHRSEAELLKETLGSTMFDLRVPQAADIARAAEWSDVKRGFDAKYGAGASVAIRLGEEFLEKSRYELAA